MSSLSKFRDNLESDLSDQLTSLRKEVAALRSTLSKQSSRSYDDISDTVADLVDSFMSNTKGARKQFYSSARQANKVAQDNPVTTAAVGLVAVGLIAALFLSRR